MKKLVKRFLIASVIFLIIDGIWLGFVAWPLYQNEIGHLLKPVIVAPAALFYVIYVIGLLVFVINPALENQSINKALGLGFLFGVMCYATYDLTNMATLKDWSELVTVIDIVWGGVVSALTAVLTFIVSRKVESVWI